ncbi:MAG: alpha/beta fold hydrolase [Gammaproteobacteria bacterium]
METLKFKQIGSENGLIVIYFHGVPGSPEECRIFDLEGKACNLTFICFDRLSVDSSLKGESYYQFLAKEISKKANGQQVDVVGFSIGAFIALQTCRYLENVRNLHLISAVAPLDTGDFLDLMAGKRVFQLAKTFPVLFQLLSYWQGLLALLFPNALFKLLFASAAGNDKALATDCEFQASIIKTLKSCFIGHIEGYKRDIRAYVLPWETTLSEISVNTYIWHGAEDNWSPKCMAVYLNSAIQSCSHVEIIGGLSHYSCLYETAPKICNQLGKTK